MLDDERIVSQQESEAILSWLKGYDNLPLLNYQHFSRPDGRYNFRLEKREPAQIIKRLKKISWLPTTHGLVRPLQAFLPRLNIKEILGDTVPYFEGKLPEDTINKLSIRSELTVEEVLDVLKDSSGKPSANPEMIRRIYFELESRTRYHDYDICSEFKKNKLIFVLDKEKNGSWHSENDCVWKDSSNALGDDFVCLEKYYPRLKTFFVEEIGVKEQVDKEYFSRRWLKLQDLPILDTKQQRAIMETLYRELLPVAKMDEAEQPGWWGDFTDSAKIYTQSDTFESVDGVVIPDDGELKRIFQNGSINFAWRPEKDSFSDWKPFYQALNVPLLSETVSVDLVEDVKTITDTNNKQYITQAAVMMIAAWLREKRKDEYSRILEAVRGVLKLY